MRLISLVVAVLLVTTVASEANVLANAGFELDPQGSTNLIANWTVYSAGAFHSSSETGATAHGGTNYYKVYQAFNSAVNYNGIYQDSISGPGNVYTASGWAYSSASDALAGQNNFWIEVTFRDAAGAILALYRSGNITTNLIGSSAFPKSTWNNLPVTNRFNPTTFQSLGSVSNLVAPSGTSFVRYQVVFQGDQNNSGGSIYFDDLDLTQTTGTAYGTNWNLAWADEFNSTVINTNIWKFDTGAGGWGNSELEDYTSRATNVFDDGSVLHIVARKENLGGAAYTSARMKTQGLFYRLYGRFEFRAKSPQGQGYWPALWMMPEDSVYGQWAASGEIDVMENMGSDPKTVLGTIHYGGVSPNTLQSSGPSYKFAPGSSVTNFHVYVVEWVTNAVNWFIDGQLYETQTNWSSTGGSYPAPFNQSFYLIMNLAVGGNFGGNPNGSTIFPGELQVDYIRYYAQVPPLQLTVTQTNSSVLLSWPTNVASHLQQNDLAGSNVSNSWSNVSGAINPFVVDPTNSQFLFRLVSP